VLDDVDLQKAWRSWFIVGLTYVDVRGGQWRATRARVASEATSGTQVRGISVTHLGEGQIPPFLEAGDMGEPPAV
jgi:hypothetical protein